MSDTGRLSAGLGKRTQKVVFGQPEPREIADELRITTEVDLAHVVMLIEQDLLPRPAGARLLRHITRLRREDFRSLHGLAMPRGLYLAYENHLTSVLGTDIGGRLHTGRSRNDLKATVTAMRLRATLLELLGESVRCLAVLLARARAHRDTVMPLHTHYQAAMPATYGYYLLGVALALSRDIATARHAGDGLRRSPLGAGGVAGTDLPIDPARTAALLGFDTPPIHALDAVASRDVALRVLAAMAGAGVTLSRLAADLQLWSTAEFGFIEFGDHLVGGSSAMPQKRNAFLLEHVKAKPGVAIGAWTAAASAMKSTPFTNSIEVGTEAVAAVWPGLAAVGEAVLLTQVLVSGARPCGERMTAAAEGGFVTATVLANRLVRGGMPFRTAHHVVGAAVREAVARGSTRLDLDLPDGVDRPDPAELSLDEVVAAHRAGGGPGAFDDAFAHAYRELAEHHAWNRALRDRISAAQDDLAHAVSQHVG